jgi:hypothetical protein
MVIKAKTLISVTKNQIDCFESISTPFDGNAGYMNWWATAWRVLCGNRHGGS